MCYYQIISEDEYLSSYVDEITTNLPFKVLGLKIGVKLPFDNNFPSRVIKMIKSDYDISFPPISYKGEGYRRSLPKNSK